MKTLVAAAIAALMLAPAAGATHVRAHASTVQRLRGELRQTKAALARKNAAIARKDAALVRARSKLAAARAQELAAQGQATQLQGTLTQTAGSLASTQAALKSAQSQVSSLEAQLAAIPPPLSVAEEQVRREVAYQEQNNKLPYSDGRLVSQAAMEYVVGHVSASAYGYLELFRLPLPLATAGSTLGLQAGICGNAALTFAAIVKHFGYQVRSVQFYYTDPAGPAGPGAPDSHIADGVFYDGGWHYFDPTFGVYWTDAAGNVLSITDVRAGLGSEVKDAASFTNLAEDYFYGDGTAFVTDPATSVVLDGQPFVG